MGQTPEQFRENLESLEAAGFTAPPEDEWPPLYEDLPYEVQEAMRLFYLLPIKIDGMAGYTGKDLTVLSTFMDIYEVEHSIRKFVLELILFLNNRSLKTAAEKTNSATKEKANGKR